MPPPTLQPQPPPADAPPPLYADRVRVYARNVQGTFRRLKWRVSWLLLGIYFLGPWLRWDRGPGVPDQALLLHIEGRRAYVLGLEFWPQEVYYLAGLLILGAVGLFAATAMFGRLWCGFTCPQTLWTDLFMWVERLIEGDRGQRIRVDRGPATPAKVARKAAKHGIWLVISLLTGLAFVWYFDDAWGVTLDILAGTAGPWVYATLIVLTSATYLLAGWAREQVCIYMCPWPRFQAAMFDEDSLIITYEAWRGETRAKAKKGESFTDRGHCVDCSACVQVCPTGIDIRDGDQMECIGCGLCIDACDNIMDRFGLPRGLIAYDSETNRLARARGEEARLRLFRPRTLGYGAVMAVVTAVMVFVMVNRSMLDVHVLRDRAPLFVTLSDGGIRNGYTLKVLNREPRTRVFALTARGLEAADLAVVGHQGRGSGPIEITGEPDSIGTFRVFVTLPRKAVEGKSMPLTFVLEERDTGETIEHQTIFAGPGAGR